MTPLLSLLLAFLVFARCRSFVVTPTPLQPGASFQSQAQRAFSRPVRGQSSRQKASPRPSQGSMDDARQRLIDSREYGDLVDRVDGRSPFAEQGAGEAGYGEDNQPVRQFAQSALRLAIDVSIVLVPVAICVSTGKVPGPVIETCKSAAAAIGGSPLEPVVEALPWERVDVLKCAAQGGVALLLSPLTDRFVVSPALYQWTQARLRAISK